MKEIKIKTDLIQLDQFLKWANVVASGGEAKFLIQSGQIKVDGEVETRRSLKLKPGTVVELNNGEKLVLRAKK